MCDVAVGVQVSYFVNMIFIKTMNMALVTVGIVSTEAQTNMFGWTGETPWLRLQKEWVKDKGCKPVANTRSRPDVSIHEYSLWVLYT